VGQKRKHIAQSDGHSGDGDGMKSEDGHQVEKKQSLLSGSSSSGRRDINPDLLITALFSSAKVQKTPQILHARGSITLFLDANNNMQHINLMLAQVQPGATESREEHTQQGTAPTAMGQGQGQATTLEPGEISDVE
jgi:hypothetical protein